MNAHSVVWLDHRDARVFSFHDDDVSMDSIKSHPHRERHPHITRRHETRHAEADATYYRDIAGAIEGAEEVLVVGPGTAKLELVRFVQKHAPALESKIVGVETVDHPTDGQIVAYARQYFLAADRVQS